MRSSQNHSKDFIQDFFENFNSKFFLYVVKKSKIFIFIILLACIILPFLHLRYSSPVYETKATLIRKSEAQNSILDEKAINVIYSDNQEEIIKDIQILKSDFLLNKILDSLQMGVSVYKAGRLPFKKHELTFVKNGSIINSNYKIKNSTLYNKEIELKIDENSYDISYEINGSQKDYKGIQKGKIFENEDLKIQLNLFNEEYKNGEYKIVFNDRNSIKSYIQNKVEIYNQKPNLEFLMYSENSNKSEYILSNLLESFIHQDEIENSEKIQNAISYIKTFLDTINIQLQESQYKKADYATANSIYNPEDQINSNLAEIEQYQRSIDELKFRILELNSIKKSTSQSNGKNISNSEIQNLITKREELLLDYTSDHPSVVLIDKTISEKTKLYSNKLVDELKVYQSKVAKIRSNESSSKTELNAIPGKSLEFNQLNKEVEIKEKYVLYLLEKQIQYLILKSSISSDYIILQPPKTSEELKSPNKTQTYALAFFTFLLSSLGLILYRYVRFDKIINTDEVKNKLKSPILGFIPFIENAKIQDNNATAPESRLVVIDHPKSKTAEIFKKMRASLRYTGDGTYKTIAATSTISGEGKTFVLMNLAAVHAQLDKKTLIIDLDLRKPRIAKSFNLDNSKGISSILTGHNTIDECIHRNIAINNLDVISSGIIPPNPSELILSKKFDDLIIELKTRYDFIFIDTPPIGLVNESLEIINKVDIPLYLIKFNYSHKEFLDSIKELEDNSIKNNNLMLVLNHYGDGASNYINKYSYSYQYGYNNYGDGYYTSENKKTRKKLSEILKQSLDWKL